MRDTTVTLRARQWRQILEKADRTGWPPGVGACIVYQINDHLPDVPIRVAFDADQAAALLGSADTLGIHQERRE